MAETKKMTPTERLVLFSLHQHHNQTTRELAETTDASVPNLRLALHTLLISGKVAKSTDRSNVIRYRLVNKPRTYDEIVADLEAVGGVRNASDDLSDEILSLGVVVMQDYLGKLGTAWSHQLSDADHLHHILCAWGFDDIGLRRRLPDGLSDYEIEIACRFDRYVRPGVVPRLVEELNQRNRGWHVYSHVVAGVRRWKMKRCEQPVAEVQQ